MFGAAGVLVVGLGTGLVASIVGVQNLGILPDRGPDELSWVPSDVRLVAFANVADVMHSELRQKIQALSPSHDPSLSDSDNSFQAETGIDIESDIDHVVVFMAGSEPQQGPPTVLARGRFDEVRIRGFMADHGAVVQDYKGEQLLVNNEQRIAVTFVEPGFAIVGTPASVRRSVDTKASGADIRSNTGVMDRIKDADSGNAWAVARFDALTQGRLPNEIANRLPNITWFTATANINGGIHGLLKADTRDEAAAQDLRDVIRGFVALARMQTDDTPALSDLMNSFELGGQGTTVSLGFTISTDIIDALAAFMPGSNRIDQPESDSAPVEPPPSAETPTL
jgi:hypothetical protein